MSTPTILFLETSGSICSVCILLDGEIHEKSEEMPNAHSKILAPMVKELLDDLSVSPQKLNAVCVSSGPGSYTGLRIGASLAKGICFARNIPLIAVSTLQASAEACSETISAEHYLALIEARREDTYAGMYNPQFETVVEEKFITLDDETLSNYKIDDKTAICGSGAQKYFEMYPDSVALNGSKSGVYARHLVSLGLKRFESEKFEDLTYFEPNYIKSVFVTKPKRKI